MKKFMCRCGLFMLVLVLAASIFYVIWSMKNRNVSDGGTLVKNMCNDAREYLHLG